MYEVAKLPDFAHLGAGTWIAQPFGFGHADHISIGSNCKIGKGCDFGIVKNQDTIGNIILGNNVTITARCQIFSSKQVKIDDYVLIGTNVFISDCTHGYSDDGATPYVDQELQSIHAINIGRGTWIGQNVIILPGANIGKQCIIGANSIVKSDIPDGCIAVGSPARVIKKWDVVLKKWISHLL